MTFQKCLKNIYLKIEKNMYVRKYVSKFLLNESHKSEYGIYCPMLK